MKIIALMTAIAMLKAAKGIAWAAEIVADGGVWIIDQYDPRTPANRTSHED
ncbi:MULTISPECIES: hypothetical protein [unclassified Rhizobium]|uniref:hypothetical protein n=1 Tax=unclassified Rhizobium TaxID=2613769 RepID=UPI000ADEF28C|nr:MULTISPECIES: hypothetical protein [unclassified Rhizobium]